MRTALLLALAISAGVCVSGCYETKQEFTLNPDGSGKVILDAAFQPQMINLMGEDSSPDKRARDAVRGILENSKGVDAWRDVSFKIMDDDRIRFNGTAYFKNVADLAFHNLGNTKISFAKDARGYAILGIKVGKEKDGSKKTVARDLTDAEVEKEIKKQRANYKQQVKPMMAAYLANMKEDMFFRLPGTIKGEINLKKTEDGRIHFALEGSKMLEAMDKIIDDDEFLRKEIKSGGNLTEEGPSSDNLFNEMLFGTKGPVRAVLSGPFEPQFDYQAEVKLARANYAELTKAIGVVTSIPIAEPAKGGGFKSVKVGGVRLVRSSDQEGDILPFHSDAGYFLSIVGELPGSAISVEGGEIMQAVADNGANLLPERERDRKIDVPRLSKNRATVTFEAHLSVPADDVRGIKELSGTIRYLVAAGSKEIDLGIRDFTAGIKGEELGAVINSVEKSKWGDGESLSLELDLRKDAIKDVKFHDETGTQMEFSGTGSSWSGEQTTLTYTYREKFPAAGRIVVEVYEEQQMYEIPFKLENISLMGQPLR